MQRGLSQEELAEVCEISRQTICRWESGERIPSLNALENIAKKLNIPLSEFLTCGESAACVEDEPQESTACAADELQGSAAPAETVQEIFVERGRRVARRALAAVFLVLLTAFLIGSALTIIGAYVVFSNKTDDVTVIVGTFSGNFFIYALALTVVLFFGTGFAGICLLKIRKKGKRDEVQTQNLDDGPCTCSDVDRDFAAPADGAPPRECSCAGDCGGASNGKQR